MKLGSFPKQPGERINTSVVYSDALDDGDGISSVQSCVVEPSGLQAVPVLVSESRVRVVVSGGLDGVSYKITLTVQTAGGEILEDELVCKVKSI